MHVRELVEFGVLVTRHGPLLMHQNEPIPEKSLEGYWASSKCRFDRWQRALKTYETQSRNSARSPRQNARWQVVKPTLEEILISELLMRVWTAVVCAVDRLGGKKEAEPIVRNVMLGHLEARHRALNLLVFGPGIEIEEAVAMNRIRRRVERWTDMLIGHLVVHHDVREFALNPTQAVEFARDLREEALSPSSMGWQLTQTSLRAAFHGLAETARSNSDMNSAIVSSIMLSFRPELFDSMGLFRSLWLERLSTAASDSQGMIEDLLALDETTAMPQNAQNYPSDLPHLRRWD